MANIVVTGVDGSETATRAAQRAAEIAVAFQASLHIVSAYGPREQRQLADGEGGRMVISLQDTAERYVAEAADTVRADMPDVEVTAAVVKEAITEEFVRDRD